MASSPRIWLVTGCSSGFGTALVHQVLSRGDHVIATGRNIETKLSHLSNTAATLLELDVNKDVTYMKKQIATAVAVHGRIDVLVNNAGYLQCGPVEELDEETLGGEMQTEFFGPVWITQAMLPYMRKAGKGVIAYVGSMGGFCGLLGAPAYSASKFALEGLVEAMALEVPIITGHKNIQFFMFEPGNYTTDVLTPDKVKLTENKLPEYKEYLQYSRKSIDDFNGVQPGDTNKAVKVMIDVITKTGVAEGKDVPFRFPLGDDAYKMQRKKCLRTLQVLDEWEAVVRSTMRDGVDPETAVSPSDHWNL